MKLGNSMPTSAGGNLDRGRFQASMPSQRTILEAIASRENGIQYVRGDFLSDSGHRPPRGDRCQKSRVRNFLRPTRP